jgi:hypothetical protein
MILNNINSPGRFCNQVFRFIAISILGKKHNLKIQYFEHYIDQILKLGIILFNGENDFSRKETINDKSFMHYLNLENIDYSFTIGHYHFQNDEKSDLIFKYIRNDCKNNIINNNN